MATQSIDDHTISVNLGDLSARAEARVQSGDYSSISEVLREGLRALDREDEDMLHLLKLAVAEIDNDPSEDIPMEEAFAEMDVFIADYRAKAAALRLDSRRVLARTCEASSCI